MYRKHKHIDSDYKVTIENYRSLRFIIGVCVACR